MRERQTLTIRSLETDRQRERHIYKETQIYRQTLTIGSL